MAPEIAAWRELTGYLASGLVLATFCVRDMAFLRMFAIASNVAFITYGYLAAVHPVLALHLLLLPTNLFRLSQVLRARRILPGAGARGSRASVRGPADPSPGVRAGRAGVR